MNRSRIYRKVLLGVLVLASSAMLMGCSLVGLDLQESHKHESTILPPDIHMTAWEFLNKPLEDTLRSFERMRDAVIYAGLEDEYIKTGRTFLVFNNYAILRYNSSGSVNSNCYFGRNRVPVLDDSGEPVTDEAGELVTRAATSWADYPVEQVRNLLLYHILEGEYSYHNLGPDNTVIQSLSPVDTANIVYLSILNNRDAKLRVNDFPGTIQSASARTANLKATNGYVHVFDVYHRYGVSQ